MIEKLTPDRVWFQVRDKVWGKVWGQVRTQVEKQVWDRVWDQVAAPIIRAQNDHLNLSQVVQSVIDQA